MSSTNHKNDSDITNDNDNDITNDNAVNENGRQICQFYSKMGACRHGDICIRIHLKPKQSKVICFNKLYDNPKYIKGLKKNNLEQIKEEKYDEDKIQNEINTIYKDLFVELSLSYGYIKKLIICENVNNHLSGNVYVMFKNESDAFKCFKSCNDRWFNNKPIFCELSMCQDFNDANCRSYNSPEGCSRGGLCNFHHIRSPDHKLIEELNKSQNLYYDNM
ncbi:hypothetical protein CANARDRAFT_30060 [[Candida] arabinofermentans NRRL YB-2248]|uniref:C3H1-type domain-containing protein n=1 Tax=[Candida] arabinofermentans NRRL YB-2248 TaxID=983967 RepID=A0A1E4SUU5_9ASCO|nr:hypothetical protein CANARDRAFT_30060 [[Candida] arabinofermentans NRRL YB-2248]